MATKPPGSTDYRAEQGGHMDVYAIVTERILQSLDKGTIPWRCPWRKGDAGIPKNLVSKKPYSGINPFMLTVESITKGYTSPYWLTFKQAQELGGHVNRGEKSSIVVFWKMLRLLRLRYFFFFLWSVGLGSLNEWVPVGVNPRFIQTRENRNRSGFRGIGWLRAGYCGMHSKDE